MRLAGGMRTARALPEGARARGIVGIGNSGALMRQFGALVDPHVSGIEPPP
jgi:hypothetical protein